MAMRGGRRCYSSAVRAISARVVSFAMDKPKSTRYVSTSQVSKMVGVESNVKKDFMNKSYIAKV